MINFPASVKPTYCKRRTQSTHQATRYGVVKVIYTLTVRRNQR